MKMTINIVRIFTLIAGSMLFNINMHAQNLTIDISNPGQGPSAGMVRVTNVGAIGDKKVTGLTYEDVEGLHFGMIIGTVLYYILNRGPFINYLRLN